MLWGLVVLKARTAHQSGLSSDADQVRRAVTRTHAPLVMRRHALFLDTVGNAQQRTRALINHARALSVRLFPVLTDFHLLPLRATFVATKPAAAEDACHRPVEELL